MKQLRIADCGLRNVRRIGRIGRIGRIVEIRNPHSAFRNGSPSFTMIELLLVIAIIGIIISAIVVASFAAGKKGQIDRTRGVMQQIKLALATYKLEHGMFVPAQEVALYPDLNSTYALWQALELDGKYFTAQAENKLAGDSDPYDRDADGNPITRYKYIDAWQQPLWYQCPPMKLNAAGDGWEHETGDFSRFRLVSSGPDKVLGAADTDAAIGDNIIVE